MPDEQPDEPSPGPPPYPGSVPPPYPGNQTPPYPGTPEPPYPGAQAPPPRDDWYRPPPPPGGGGGYYYPPGSPPPGQWGGAPGYGYGAPQGYPGAAPYASYWARVGGFLLDAVIVFVVSLVYLLPAHAFQNTYTVNNGTSTLHYHFATGGVIVPLIIEVLYASLLIGWRGQTLGMMAARTKAVDGTTGALIGPWRALGRDLFERVLGFLFAIPLLIDLLFPAWDPRRQTLHDKVTNTVVIKV